MAQTKKSKKYEENYGILERITDSLNKDEIGIDDLVEKTREALNAARSCMEILNEQKGEFKKLEIEFSNLLQNNTGDSMDNTNSSPAMDEGMDEDIPGNDDPF